MLAGRRVAVLTGAGISTDSGLPDYRGPDSPPRRPITFQQFVGDERFRRHYWARNHVGWHHMRETAPNAGHRALARLEQAGVVVGVITQNVDLLHQAAGSRRVIDLHGHYNEVVCLNCGHVEPRSVLHERLDALNPGFVDRVVADVEIAPDADAVVEETEDFRVAPCPVCGGMLKPNIVFFGENVPRPRVAAALEPGRRGGRPPGRRLLPHRAQRAPLRPARRPHRPADRHRQPRHHPGDDLATVKIDAGTTPVLVALADRLAPAGGDGLYRQQAGDPVADQR